MLDKMLVTIFAIIALIPGIVGAALLLPLTLVITLDASLGTNVFPYDDIDEDEE